MQLEPHPESSLEPEPTAARAASEALEQQNGGAWPRSVHRDTVTPQLTSDETEASDRYDWQP